MLSQDAQGLAGRAREIRMCPLFDPAVLGATPCGRLVYSSSTCESLLVHGGWSPQEAQGRVANMSTVMLKGWPGFV